MNEKDVRRVRTILAVALLKGGEIAQAARKILDDEKLMIEMISLERDRRVNRKVA